MKGQVKLSYSAILIGNRKDEQTINVPADMVGLSQASWNVQLDWQTCLTFVEEWLTRTYGKAAAQGYIDIRVVVDADGYQPATVFLRHGFSDDLVNRYSLLAPVPEEKPATKPQEARELARESKYAAKQRKAVQEAQEPVSEAPETLAKPKKREFVWRDRTDDEDAIPDDQLTPSQRRRRKAIAEAAERQSYAAFSRR